MSAKELKEDEFRERFDAGESLESLGFDLDKAVIDEPAVKRVNVDFPDAIVAKLDRHCALMGITRQSLIKVWIFERLKEEAASTSIEGLPHTPPLSAMHTARKVRELTRPEEEYILAENPLAAHCHAKKRRLKKVRRRSHPTKRFKRIDQNDQTDLEFLTKSAG